MFLSHYQLYGPDVMDLKGQLEARCPELRGTFAQTNMIDFHWATEFDLHLKPKHLLSSPRGREGGQESWLLDHI